MGLMGGDLIGANEMTLRMQRVRLPPQVEEGQQRLTREREEPPQDR